MCSSRGPGTTGRDSAAMPRGGRGNPPDGSADTAVAGAAGGCGAGGWLGCAPHGDWRGSRARRGEGHPGPAYVRRRRSTRVTGLATGGGTVERPSKVPHGQGPAQPGSGRNRRWERVSSGGCPAVLSERPPPSGRPAGLVGRRPPPARSRGIRGHTTRPRVVDRTHDPPAGRPPTDRGRDGRSPRAGAARPGCCAPAHPRCPRRRRGRRGSRPSAGAGCRTGSPAAP
jgi:hypothetical protein